MDLIIFPDISTIFFVSFCAGFGEEVLFRGVLQPKLGIWLTAVIFVGIHGYLNPNNWRISIYGIYLTIVIALTGYLSRHFGLTTAIITHMIIDVILFYKLAKNNKLISCAIKHINTLHQKNELQRKTLTTGIYPKELILDKQSIGMKEQEVKGEIWNLHY